MSEAAQRRGIGPALGALLASIRGRRDELLGLLALAVPAAAWLGLAGILYPPIEAYPTGDYARIELYTRLAAEGSQRLGTESRFHFHQAGPIFFYAAAPVYLLFGGTTPAMAAAALVWNLVFLAALLRSAARLAPGYGPLVAVLALGAFVGARGLGVLLSPWNPHVALLPFAVVLLGAARLATGEGRALPLVAVAATAVAQSQVAWALPLAIASSAGSLLCLWPSARRRLRIPTLAEGLRRRSLAWTVAVLALLWALPILDEVTAPYHNLRRMLAVGSGSASPRGWSDALLPAARGLGLRLDGAQPASIVAGTDEQRPELRGASLEWRADRLAVATDVARTALLVAALLAAGGLAARRGAGTSALAWIAGTGVLSIPLLIRSLPGRALPTYLFQWGSMVTVAALTVIGCELVARALPLQRLARGAVRGGLLALVSASLLAGSARVAAKARPERDARSLEIEALTHAVAAQARRDVPGRRFLVRVAPQEDAAVVIGLVLALDKARLRFGVEPFGSSRIEGRLSPRGDEWAELVLGDLPAGEGGRPLSTSGSLTAVWRLRWRPTTGRAAGVEQ